MKKENSSTINYTKILTAIENLENEIINLEFNLKKSKKKLKNFQN